MHAGLLRLPRLLAAFVPLLLLSLVLVVGVQPAGGRLAGAMVRGAQPPDELSQNVDLAKLRKQAMEARKKLERGTQRLKRGQQRLEEARNRLESTKRDLARTTDRLHRLRKPLARIANDAYQEPSVGNVASILTSNHPERSMRAAVDLDQIAVHKQGVIQQARGLQRHETRLVRGAAHLTDQTEGQKKEQRALVRDLKRQAHKSTDRLSHTLERLGLHVSRASLRQSLGCDPHDLQARNFPNGLIPSWALCPLPEPGEMLRADAALAFIKLNDAYVRHFGRPICVTDSYRSLAVQERLYVTKPGLAAVPGTSNHGRGLATDLCGGIQRFGSTEYNWMKANAPRFGWYHPGWAEPYGSRPEPWHWEYGHIS